MPPDTPLRLFAGDRLIGFLEPHTFDWPRVYASFTPTEKFDEVSELFHKQSPPDVVDDVSTTDALAAMSRRMEAFSSMSEEMDALDLSIVDPAGGKVRLRTIIIEGNRAMWREGYLRHNRIARQDAFWKVLGEEVGPQQCREPECSRLKITQSVFCKRHHYRMIMGEDYEGSLE